MFHHFKWYNSVCFSISSDTTRNKAKLVQAKETNKSLECRWHIIEHHLRYSLSQANPTANTHQQSSGCPKMPANLGIPLALQTVPGFSGHLLVYVIYCSLAASCSLSQACKHKDKILFPYTPLHRYTYQHCRVCVPRRTCVRAYTCVRLFDTTHNKERESQFGCGSMKMIICTSAPFQEHNTLYNERTAWITQKEKSTEDALSVHSIHVHRIISSWTQCMKTPLTNAKEAVNVNAGDVLTLRFCLIQSLWRQICEQFPYHYTC